MKSVISFLLTLVSAAAFAQPAEDQAVMQPIAQLFQGMNQGDSAMVRACFADEVSLVTLGTDKAGKAVRRTDRSIKNLLVAVGTPHAEPWSEPIWDVQVQREGALAHVWARYAFYVGKKFSHCGIDSFQLMRTAEGEWKIFQLADTRVREGCTIPEHIAAPFR
ncbi:MAG: nuclear transport factor 2 family protein [Cyclobacteriaceae bacterium]|jgi:hypothetical protein|nr:nuclear transport factor 2 family protein [Cyclobacteriaceae bacterium]